MTKPIDWREVRRRLLACSEHERRLGQLDASKVNRQLAEHIKAAFLDGLRTAMVIVRLAGYKRADRKIGSYMADVEYGRRSL